MFGSQIFCDKIKVDDMGWACSTYGREEKSMQVLVGNLTEGATWKTYVRWYVKVKGYSSP